jgi:hypothetical protein
MPSEQCITVNEIGWTKFVHHMHTTTFAYSFGDIKCGGLKSTSVCVCDTELMDEVQVAACNKYSKLTLKETPMLMLEFHGSKNTVEEQAKIAGMCLTVDISLWLL